MNPQAVTGNVLKHVNSAYSHLLQRVICLSQGGKFVQIENRFSKLSEDLGQYRWMHKRLEAQPNIIDQSFPEGNLTRVSIRLGIDNSVTAMPISSNRLADGSNRFSREPMVLLKLSTV